MAKNREYGTSWRVMRASSIADQIFIKAQRIRTIEEKNMSQVDEGVESEFMGVINYCIIGLIQISLTGNSNLELGAEELSDLYDRQVAATKSLMEKKNHDYGEAWRDMLVSTFTDMLLMRIMRIRQLSLTPDAKSEGIDSNLQDMLNYSVFALIQLEEKRNK